MLRLEGDPFSEIEDLEISDPQSIRELSVRDLFPKEERSSRIQSINILSDFSNLIEKKSLRNDYLKIIEQEKNKNDKNPFILPEFPSNRIMDHFISSTILRNNEQIIPIIPSVVNIPQPAVVAERTVEGHFSAEGFSADLLSILPFSTRYSINGEVIGNIAANSPQYARVDFMPNGRYELDRKKMTESLAKGISGLVKYFQAIDRGDVQPADLLMGTTNLHMALICQRIGFSIVDQCKTEDGQINKTLYSFHVVGKAEDVRHKVEEFQRAGVVERLCKREQRLQARSLIPRLSPLFA